MDLLKINHLTFRYPETDCAALDDVSLSVRAGEFILLCGESGCGKSTLLKLLKPAVAPFGVQQGEILYGGIPLTALDDRRAAADIGFVLQNPESQIVTDVVWHELAFGLESLGFDTQTIRRRVAEMAGYFGIESWFHQKTADLSGGQKQLLNLASVMAMQPKLLLLDEPTAQLDPIAAANFVGTLQKLNRELGLTVLLVEHRLEEVFPIADRVALMERGRVTFADRPQQILSCFRARPDHPMRAGLPAAMRIFDLLGDAGEAPITVREGRAYIAAHYGGEGAEASSSPGSPHLASPAAASPPSKHPTPAVSLGEVFFRYERNQPDVLRGVSLQVSRGEHFCLVGGNGTGKTTTLKVIAGLCRPYRGRVKTDGGVVALLPQDPQTVFLEKTVREDLGAVCTDAARISAVIEQLGLAAVLDAHPYDLSGGEQQKAALAKILLLSPQILLLDEPTKGIDAHAKQTLADILRALQAEGMTIITVTHDVEFAAEVADRCGMFFDGEIVSVGTTVDFFAENSFYTTAANRIARGYYPRAVTCAAVAACCQQSGRRGERGGANDA